MDFDPPSFSVPAQVPGKEMTPDQTDGQGSFLFSLGLDHWVTSLSAGSTGAFVVVGIPSAAFTVFSLRLRVACM